MSAITEIGKVFEIKDDALLLAIETLNKHRDPICTEGHCEQESNYHWRGCPTVIDPITKKLLEAIESR